MEASPELGARVRAACAYANYKPKLMARKLSMSYSTYHRIESGERELKEPAELETFLAITGLPRSFLTMDFAAIATPSDTSEVIQLRERVELLEAQENVRRLEKRHADLAGLARSPAARPDTERPR